MTTGPGDAPVLLSDEALTQLKRSRPWASFLAFAGFFLAVVSMLGGLATLSAFRRGPASAFISTMVGLALSVVFLVAASFLMRSYARNLALFLAGRTEAFVAVCVAKRRMWIMLVLSYGLFVFYALLQIVARLFGVELDPSLSG